MEVCNINVTNAIRNSPNPLILKNTNSAHEENIQTCRIWGNLLAEAGTLNRHEMLHEKAQTCRTCRKLFMEAWPFGKSKMLYDEQKALTCKTCFYSWFWSLKPCSCYSCPQIFILFCLKHSNFINNTTLPQKWAYHLLQHFIPSPKVFHSWCCLWDSFKKP